MAPQRCSQRSRQHRSSRSCSRWRAIPSAAASSLAWRGRAATPPAFTRAYGTGRQWLELARGAPIAPVAIFAIRHSYPGLTCGPSSRRRHPPPRGRPVKIRRAEYRARVRAFKEPNGGLYIALGPLRLLIAFGSLPWRARALPAMHTVRDHVKAGGLISYGATGQPFRRAADYVDRILEGRSRPTCQLSNRPNSILSLT